MAWVNPADPCQVDLLFPTRFIDGSYRQRPTNALAVAHMALLEVGVSTDLLYPVTTGFDMPDGSVQWKDAPGWNTAIVDALPGDIRRLVQRASLIGLRAEGGRAMRVRCDSCVKFSVMDTCSWIDDVIDGEVCRKWT